MKFRNFIYFIISIALGILLLGCQLVPKKQSQNQQVSKTNQTFSNKEEDKRDETHVFTGKEYENVNINDISFPIMLVTKLEQPNLLKNVEQLKGERGKIIVYLDDNCQTQSICDKKNINQALKFLGITGVQIVYKSLSSNIDIYVPAIVIPADVIKNVEKNPQALQIVNNPQYFKKQQDYYITVIGNWENGKENLCNDGMDNDRDGKVDEKDNDCKQYFAVFYKNKDFQVDRLLSIYKDRLYGFIVTGISVDSDLGKGIIKSIIDAYNSKAFYKKQNTILELNDGKYRYAILQKPIVKVEKVDKPKAYLYVMSHCPFGLQAEKAYLDIIEAFSGVADVQIRYVPYIMHGYQEAEDNVIQYCVSKTYPDKFIDYMKCFLSKEDEGGANSKKCLEKIGLSMKDSSLKKCYEEIAKKVDLKGIKSSKERFPRFNLDITGALQAGVQGSPTFVLNGVKVEGIQRSARAYAEKICQSFKTLPEVCKHLDKFSDVVYDPGFGWTSGGKNVGNASCGGN